MLIYKIMGGYTMTRMHGLLAGIVFLLLLVSSGLAQAAPDDETVKVDSAGKLAGVIRALNWDREGPYTTAQGMNVSRDIETTRSVSLTAKDIAIPAVCLKRDDCRKAVTMVIPRDMTRVKCTKTEDVLGTEHCVEAMIMEKTIFRIRGKLVDTHPFTYNFIPVVEFLSPSTQGCKPGELQCAKDKTCWKNFNGYCRYCLGRPVDKCACQNEKGPLPDKTACSFFISGDLMCMGKCRDGQCESVDERCR